MKKNMMMLLLVMPLLFISLVSCASNDTKEIKYENKELKEYILKTDEEIQKAEQLYNSMLEAKNNNTKVDNDEKIHFDSATIGQELERLNDEANKTDLKSQISVHSELIIEYSYNLSKATNLLAMMGSRGWDEFSNGDDYLSKQYNESLVKLEKIRPVYKESKEKILNETIYKK